MNSVFKAIKGTYPFMDIRPRFEYNFFGGVGCWWFTSFYTFFLVKKLHNTEG